MHYEQQTCSLVQREGCRICRTTVQLDVYLIAPFCTESHEWNGDNDVLFYVANTWLTCGQVAHFWMKIPVWIVTQCFTVTITIAWKKNFVSSFLGAARNRAFENSRFSSLLTSPAAKIEEKRLFSQASGMGHTTKNVLGVGNVSLS